MRITVKTSPTADVRSELLAIPLTQSESTQATKGSKSPAPLRLPRKLAALDRTLGGVIGNALASGDFSGKRGQSILLYAPSGAAIRRVLLVGLGKASETNHEQLRRFAATCVGRHGDNGIERIAILAPTGRRLTAVETAGALTEGVVLGAYRFDAYRSNETQGRSLKTVTLIFERLSDPASTRRSVTNARIAAESQNVARGLSNEPPNKLPPSALAREARKMARECGLTCRVMKAAELERRGMNALLAVGGGSSHPPVLIVLEHRGKASGGKLEKPVCIVGKGITFDSGGISLKPPAGMGDMKHDMSGAATVVGVMRAVALQKLPIHLIGIIAAAENMPSGTAYRPGDIIEGMSGKTIEITNTDAEGRVVLSDALHYACSTLRPAAIVDIATLTGAAMIAFGPWATAAVGNDEALIEALRTAGNDSGELVWPLPLLPEHKQAMTGTVADLVNSAGRDAGVSTAAAFLSEFVGNTKWVHLDIAGTGWTSKRTPYHRGGATGVGVRTLLAWLRRRVHR